MKATKIFLGIPAQNATVHVGILDFLSRVRGGLFKYGDRMFDIECGFVAHVSPIEGARNVLVRNFLNSDCDHLLFVDADVYPAETGLMILDAIDKADIITGRVTIWMPTKDKDRERLQARHLRHRERSDPLRHRRRRNRLPAGVPQGA